MLREMCGWKLVMKTVPIGLHYIVYNYAMAALFSLIKQSAKSAIRLYYQVRHTPLVWRALNHKAIRLHKTLLPVLDATSARIVSNLAKNGIAVVPIEELFPNQNKFQELSVYAQKLEHRASVKTNKEFLQFYLDDEPVLDLGSPLVKLALEEKMLAIVNSYMGMYSKFYYLTLNKTLPQGGEAKAVQSMRWHRDPEDRKMVKVFMYLGDVDEAAGPFVYVQGSHTEGTWGSIFPPEPPRGSLPPPDEIKKIIPETDIRTCTGKAGTIIFCDTRGIHRGGHALSKERVMLTLGYCSPASLWPLRYRYPAEFGKDTLDNLPLSPAARYALDNFSIVGKKLYKY